ncbi:MAG: phosphoglyceromutase [Chitinophagaceae bacterium]|nr:phosphoglyceromutase [Chitinophagaceae bacterium]
MKIIMKVVLALTFCSQLMAQNPIKNIVIVTLDGMRWQEVFNGADPTLLNNNKFTPDIKELSSKFWAETNEIRRAKLFPFLWSTVKQNGRIYGNRNAGNYVNVANRYHISYPGYNEIFSGYPDTAISSNKKIPNPNETVLQFINRQKGYEGKVAAFTSWDVFPYIFNSAQSGVYVNADIDTLKFSTPQFSLLNDIQFLSTKPIGVRTDVLTYMAAREYMKTYKPRVLYIGLDETDDYAHRGEYDHYLESANASDAMLADLWRTIQSIPQYKDKTTLIITCDHGRGDKIKENWRHHEKGIEESGETWIAMMGPGIIPAGEMQGRGQLYQQQIAATIAQLLGLKFRSSHPVAAAIEF